MRIWNRKLALGIVALLLIAGARSFTSFARGVCANPTPKRRISSLASGRRPTGRHSTGLGRLRLKRGTETCSSPTWRINGW